MLKFFKRAVAPVLKSPPNNTQNKSVTFLPNEKAVGFSGRTTVLELAHLHEIEISSSCGGMGSCGTCRVHVDADLLPPRNEIENEMAADRGFAPAERLACQTLARNGMKIIVGD